MASLPPMSISRSSISDKWCCCGERKESRRQNSDCPSFGCSPSLEDDDRSIDSYPQQSPYGGRQSQQCGVWKDLFLDIICTSRSPLIDTHRTSAFVQLSDLRDARAALRHLPILGLRVFENSSKTNFFLSSISQFFKHLEWNPPSGHYNCGHLNTQQNYTAREPFPSPKTYD